MENIRIRFPTRNIISETLFEFLEIDQKIENRLHFQKKNY